MGRRAIVVFPSNLLQNDGKSIQSSLAASNHFLIFASGYRCQLAQKLRKRRQQLLLACSFFFLQTVCIVFKRAQNARVDALDAVNVFLFAAVKQFAHGIFADQHFKFCKPQLIFRLAGAFLGGFCQLVGGFNGLFRNRIFLFLIHVYKHYSSVNFLTKLYEDLQNIYSNSL